MNWSVRNKVDGPLWDFRFDRSFVSRLRRKKNVEVRQILRLCLITNQLTGQQEKYHFGDGHSRAQQPSTMIAIVPSLTSGRKNESRTKTIHTHIHTACRKTACLLSKLKCPLFLFEKWLPFSAKKKKNEKEYIKRGKHKHELADDRVDHRLDDIVPVKETALVL